MDNWVLNGPKMLEKQKQQEQKVEEGQVKVRITRVMLTSYDTMCYTGELRLTYPKTIGRVAIGIVTEMGGECYGIKKGTKVYLNAVRACGKCYACKTGKRDECTSPRVVCRDFDGFCRDFVVCSYTDVSPIPDDMDEMLAMCIEDVALAENIYDKLNLTAGNRIAIMGGGYFGTILTQMAVYHKLVPIVIDNNPKNVERLKRSGAYFTFPSDDSLIENIVNATSGNMCNAAIYTTCCKLSPSVTTDLLAKDSVMVIGGTCKANVSMNTAPIFEKNLKVIGACDGYGYIEPAINMLVHGAIDLSNFEKEELSKFDLNKILTARSETFSHTGKMTVLKFM